MINIEKNVETALYKSAYQGLKIYFEPLKGKPFHITSLDIVEGSFQIKKTSTSTNNMQIGNMSADDLSMELMNPTDSWGIGKFDDVYFCGATMRLYLLVYDQTQDIMTETPFGVYIIDNQPRALDTIKITAFSNVIRLDIPFDTSEFSSPTYIRDLVEKGLRKAGLEHNDISMFPNTPLTGLVDVSKIKSEQTITWRQVIKWCCECVGVNAISDKDGVIKFVFYDKYTPDVLRDEDDVNLETEDGEILLIDDTPTADFPLTPALRYADNSSEVAEEDVVITGFQFKVDDALYPEDAVKDYILQSENNLVFYALNEYARRNVAKTVNEKLAGFTYRPFKCNTISFPHLQTCDSVTYIKDGKQYHSIITDIVYKLNGDMTLTAKGKNKEQKAWEVLGALTPKQQAIIDSVSRKVDNTRQQLSSYENALLLFNEKMLHSMGLHKTVKDDPNGGIITYFHNMETLENSDTIYMFGASGFAWTTEGWNGGNPVWHYGFTSTGDAILNTIHAYKLSAELIETGYLRSQNGASWISLDDGTFCFRAVKDMWLDIDTNQPSYTYEDKLSLGDDGVLGVYGELRSSQFPQYSIGIGPSVDDDPEVSIGAVALRATDSSYTDGDIFQIADASIDDNKIIELRLNTKDTKFACEENLAYITNGTAYISTFNGDVQLSTYSHPYVWINYYEPQYGLRPTAYKFGNGTNGGLGDIVANRIVLGTRDEWDCAATIGGDAVITGSCWANNYYNNSTRDMKKNIQPQKADALPLIKLLKFYSYDYDMDSSQTTDNTEPKQSHIEFGLVAEESPKEIKSEDGKAINLYEFISLTAKSVQELSGKVEQQAQEIAQLKAELSALKQ